MTKVFIDSNVWLRYFVGDDNQKFKDCQNLIHLNEEGKLRSYTSTIVILEVAYTLQKFYKRGLSEVIEDIKAILKSRNLTLIEKTNLPLAISYWQKSKIKFADCLIASQLPKSISLCTYDKEFSRLKDIRLIDPAQLISQI